MNILHIIDEPYDSGITQYALKAASGLRDRGHSVCVWGLTGCFPVSEAARSGLTTLGYSHPWVSLPSLRLKLREQSPDIITAHTGSSHTLAVAVSAWHGGQKIPVIRTRADARTVKPRPGKNLLWRSTAGFIAANDQILSEHKRHYPRWPSVSKRIYEGSKESVKASPSPGGSPLIGIVGRLDPVKGHSDFLKAAAHLLKEFPDVRFIVIGRQENVKSNDLLRMAHSLKIGERVEFAGHVPDVRDYMRRCHIGVIASTGSEAVSRVAVEWMSMGRPLIATGVGCLPEYLSDGKTGLLVPPRAPIEMGRALGRLVSDSALRDRMGNEAKKRFSAVFTLERFLDETEHFYEKAIANISSR